MDQQQVNADQNPGPVLPIDSLISIFQMNHGFWGHVDTCGCYRCPNPVGGDPNGAFPDEDHGTKYNHGLGPPEEDAEDDQRFKWGVEEFADHSSNGSSTAWGEETDWVQRSCLWNPCIYRHESYCLEFEDSLKSARLCASREMREKPFREVVGSVVEGTAQQLSECHFGRCIHLLAPRTGAAISRRQKQALSILYQVDKRWCHAALSIAWSECSISDLLKQIRWTEIGSTEKVSFVRI